jgi:putative membrane protein
MLLLAASAATLTACASSMPMPDGRMGMGMNAGANGMTMGMTPTDAMGYSRMAAASDLFEIQSSQIALQVSQNPQIRQMAQALIRDHTQTTATLMAAARAAGMTPPVPMLDPRKAQMIEQLRRTPAAQFDMTFLMQQIPAHQEALALHGAYAQRGDRPQLRAAASAAVPIVQAHLQMAQGMHDGMRM